MKQSPLFQLNWNDALKGLIIATVTPVLVAVERLIDAGKMDFSWKSLAMIGIGGGVSYLLKNFLTTATPTKEVTKTEDGTVTKTVVQTHDLKVTVNPAPEGTV